MKNKKLKILLKKVGQEPKIKFIDNTLKAKQELVGGLIEVLDFENDTLIICNEEGKILNLPPNTLFDMDYIAGDYFVVGNDFEKADFKSLTDEQIKNITPIIQNKSLKYSKKDLEEYSSDNPFVIMAKPKKELLDLIEDYENDFLTKLDDESNEHIAEDYKEDFEI